MEITQGGVRELDIQVWIQDNSCIAYHITLCKNMYQFLHLDNM